MYKKQELYEKALAAVETQNFVFISDIAAYLAITPQTFYNHFPVDSDEYKEIQLKINKNKIELKTSIRRKLYQMDNPTSLIALYKLIATEEEKRALAKFSQSKQEIVAPASNATIEIEEYEERIVVMLKAVNRYSDALRPEITAMASDMAMLDSAKHEIKALKSPFILEETTQGTKMVLHPAYALQSKASENIAKHAKTLGLDYENAPASSYESPLESMTQALIEANKASTAFVAVKKQITKKRKK